jgi:hypothetical protein
VLLAGAPPLAESAELVSLFEESAEPALSVGVLVEATEEPPGLLPL